MALKLPRRGRIPPFIAMDVLRAANEAAAAGSDVLHLEVGQPSTPAPAGVLAAARAALGRETLGYTDALGMPALREAIAAHYRDSYGVAVDPARVAVTTGSSGAFLLAFLAAFDAGDRVAMAAPAYPAYRNILTALDLVPVELPAGPAERYQVTLDLLRGQERRHRRAHPREPGQSHRHHARAGRARRASRAIVASAGIRLVSDEIYHGIVYGGVAATALASSDEAFVVNSFSKYFSMTGWRLGWVVLPPDAAARRRVPGAESLHLAADAVAARGARRLRMPRRARRQCRALCRQPRAAARRAAEGRLRALRAGRRRLLPLCRNRASHQ